MKNCSLTGPIFSLGHLMYMWFKISLVSTDSLIHLGKYVFNTNNLPSNSFYKSSKSGWGKSLGRNHRIWGLGLYYEYFEDPTETDEF